MASLTAIPTKDFTKHTEIKEENVMKTYKVTYVEKLIHTFYVEANNEEEAERAFEEGCENSQFDFSDGEIDDTDYWVEEDNDEHHYHYTPSSTNGDYSPSNPWDAPGMSISDFI